VANNGRLKHHQHVIMKRDRLAEETHQIITITVKTIVATVIAIKVADISKEEVVVKNLIAQNLKIKLKIFFPENKTKTRQDLSTKNFFWKAYNND
jgi:hypothetical protein